MTIGQQLAAAIAGKDTDRVRALLAPDVDFKGLTPGRLWEADTADEAVAILFDTWFGPDDHIETLVRADQGEDVADVHRIGYRLEVTTPDGPHLVEQQAYYRVTDDRVDYIRIVCSGFRAC